MKSLVSFIINGLLRPPNTERSVCKCKAVFEFGKRFLRRKFQSAIQSAKIALWAFHRTSTEQVNCAENENVMLVVRCLGRNQLSQKELMGKVGLRHRPTFIENYISPSINSGCVRMLYPDTPRHPRQKYLLTVKGLGLYNELTK